MSLAIAGHCFAMVCMVFVSVSSVRFIQYFPLIVFSRSSVSAIVFSSSDLKLASQPASIVHLQSSNTQSSTYYYIILYYSVRHRFGLVCFGSFRLLVTFKCSLLWMACVPYGLLPLILLIESASLPTNDHSKNVIGTSCIQCTLHTMTVSYCSYMVF